MSDASHNTKSSAASLDLRLLEHRVRIESDNRLAIDNLARCFDLATGHGASDHRAPDIDLRIGLTASNRAPAKAAADPDVVRLDVISDPPGVLEGCRRVRVDLPAGLTSALNLWAVNTSRRYYVFHAGAVARGGRGILLPAASYGGKSTLTAALLGLGFDLLSDEVGAIDASTGDLTPYRRALWLRPKSLAALGLEESVGAHLGNGHHAIGTDEIGARRAAGPVPLALIVLPEFQSREPTRLERLRSGPAVIALMRLSCSQKQFKVEGLDLVIDLALRLPCYRLVYSDAHQAATAITDAFEAAS